MADTTPAISVLMSVYNAESYLREAVMSILNQSFTDFEFLIFDDCSTDGSYSILKQFSDSRVKIIQNEENIGLTKTLNKAIRHAAGKYIARMDADDVSLPLRFERQVKYLDANPDVVVLGTAFKNFGNFESTTYYASTHDEIRWKQLYECHMLHPSVMMRTDFLKKHNLFYDETFRQAQDYDLWARVSQYGKLANLGEVLMHYRQCNSNITHTQKAGQQNGIDRVRRYLFQQLGIENITESELHLFRKTAYFEYENTPDYLSALENLLFKILSANNTTTYFPNDYLIEKVYFMWYHACYNNLSVTEIPKNTFYRSPISKLKSDKMGKMKFFLKSVLNR